MVPVERKYVCAFMGRRDSYQVPVALWEAGMLQVLLTDVYCPSWLVPIARLLPAVGERFAARHSAELEDRAVRQLVGDFLFQQVRHLAGFPARETFLRSGARLSLAAAREARKTKASLLLYHSYAWEAFREKYTYDIRRVLFQYHPHYGFERFVYRNYNRPGSRSSGLKGFGRCDASLGWPARVLDAWKYADMIICASSFTKTSLLWAGADERKIVVVPYGVTPRCEGDYEGVEDGVFHALFVGTGSQRKGLDCLLAAWRRLRLAVPKKLTLVCGSISDDLRRLARETPDVDLLPYVSNRELARLYSASHLFVMPSLVEGFGLVYLEALSYGCPVLGTPNTGLPDIGSEADGVFLVPPGDIDAIVGALERLGNLLMGNTALRLAAKRCALARPWVRFRKELISAISRC